MVSATELIPEMTERITRRFSPLKIILFGSHAAGRGNKFSDVDLLVVLETVTDKRQAAIEIRRLLNDLPIAKDIIVTTPDEIRRRGHLVGTILKPAIEEGVTLYERT